MRALLAIAFVVTLTHAASAQAVFDTLRGQYGSAADPATSCAANPHQMDFMVQPPHALFNWDQPRVLAEGATVQHERYDILNYDDGSLTLHQDGRPRPTDGGGRPVWILRLTEEPKGYCWGRADWPVVRCEEQQVRCDASTS